MNHQKQADLERLSKLAFRRMGECAAVVEKYYSAPPAIRDNPVLLKAYAWMLVPLSFWPLDVSGAVNHLIGRLAAGKRLDKDSQFLVDLLGEPPIPCGCETVAAYEHQVKSGNYESLIRAQYKFDMKEKVLADTSEFRADWQGIKDRFNVAKYQSETGVIRRRMVSERNFRPPGWDFKWTAKDDRFRLIFDAFCHKWVLYGMERDKQLLQKLSVNVTPFGTMIFIPRYWSLDRNRDIKWPAINRLHLARGVPRQGEKLGANQIGRRHEAQAARRYWTEATQAGLRGDQRNRSVLECLGWHPQTDVKRLRRLLKLGAC